MMKNIYFVILIFTYFNLQGQNKINLSVSPTVTTIPGKVVITDDMDYDLRHAKMAYSDSSLVINLTQNVYSHLTNPAHTLLTVVESENITTVGDSVTIISNGDYNLDFRFFGDGAGANDIYRYKLYKNNVAVGEYDISKGVTARAAWLWYLENLAAGDDLKIMITNTVDNDDITVINAMIYIEKKHD